jgi:hypothetical protein
MELDGIAIAYKKVTFVEDLINSVPIITRFVDENGVVENQSLMQVNIQINTRLF